MSNQVARARLHEYLTLEEAGKFHGHLGPFVVIGYRIGSYAVSKLDPEDEFDLEAALYIPLKTPFSCIIDGIQCSTKCTLGKWNIKWFNSDDFRIEIKCKSKNKLMIALIKKSVIEEALTCSDIVETVKKLQKIDLNYIADINVAPITQSS